MKLALVYLSYIPFGTDYLRSFLKSYIGHNTGIDHRLVILFNGHQDHKEVEPFLSILNASNINFDYLMSPEKFDIGSYFYVAGQLDAEFITFINTYSVILQTNWLNYLYLNLNKDGVGCVSATGSWSDYPHNDEYRDIIKGLRQFNVNLNKLKKAVFFRFNFYPFVKPHLRTNAFMMKRTIFLKLKFEMVKPQFLNWFFNYSGSKLKSLCFEHGNNSLTNQILKMGLRPLIVNKSGNGYEMSEWKKAKTFWIADQENLLVSDNQTLKYEQADKVERTRLSYAAWGMKNV